MITFLWMLYLATTILLTYYIVILNIDDFIDKRRGYIITDGNIHRIITITCSLLWSIWYFYFLH